MEGAGAEPVSVVERFERAMPGEDCQEPSSGGGLANTRWVPIRIGDRPVAVSGQDREPWIELDPQSMRATGSGGCNRISGGYLASGETLRFTRLVKTMMACISMDMENAFLRALERTREYRVRGRSLELLDENGRLLAQLEERNLR